MTVVGQCYEIFAAFMGTANFYRCHCHFLGEKCSDGDFVYIFFLIND
jgi:hypothetical protein